MSDEFRLEFDGTVFRFCVTSKGYNDCDYYWTDAMLSVSNWCFNYNTSGSCLEFSELEHLNCKLKSLLNDEIIVAEVLEFIEPDIQVSLNPKIDRRVVGKYTYVKEGFEIEDITAVFLLFPFLDGALTEQHYAIPLYRNGIIAFTEYLSVMIEKLK